MDIVWKTVITMSVSVTDEVKTCCRSKVYSSYDTVDMGHDAKERSQGETKALELELVGDDC